MKITFSRIPSDLSNSRCFQLLCFYKPHKTNFGGHRIYPTLFERGINRGQLNRVLIFGMEKQTTLKRKVKYV